VKVNQHAQDSAPIFELQLAYIGRRFGLTPPRAALVAEIAFPVGRRA
jgi:hypothetical protein